MIVLLVCGAFDWCLPVCWWFVVCVGGAGGWLIAGLLVCGWLRLVN